jgi:hypothetical protein
MTGERSFDQDRLFSWLAELLSPEHFDVVVTVERKATAVIRAVLDLLPGSALQWDWGRVLSSDALPYLPDNWLQGKRILVFNEMIHKGATTLTTIQAIEKNTPSALQNIRTAAFAVHEQFETAGCWRTADFRPDVTAASPDYAVFRQVSDHLYGIIRERLIQWLRNKGALLLDTEHLESTFTFTVSNRRLLNSLYSFGTPVEYEDDEGGQFPGVTVLHPQVSDIETLRRLLPKGSDLQAEAPRKVRMVRRGPKEFAFIVIWYPPIPVHSVEAGQWENAPQYIKPALAGCKDENLPELAFHLCSLVTGLELIRSVWAGLAPFVGNGIEPATPKGSEEPGSPLGHLRALYPLLDFQELELALAAAISGHKDRIATARVHNAVNWSLKERDKSQPFIVSAATRQQYCVDVLSEVVRRQHLFSIEDDLFDDERDDRKVCYPPLSWKEIWNVGRDLDVQEEIRSVVMDTAIDNALLKTAHLRVTRAGKPYLVRGFEPDSEFALEALERVAYGAEELKASASVAS